VAIADRVNRPGRKCAQCGLVNFAVSDACRRCNAVLIDAAPAEAEVPVSSNRRRSPGRQLLWLAGVIVSLIFLWSRSLLLTSVPIDAGQRQLVMEAVTLLEHAGFSREMVVLRHFANYRATDNWWNEYLGHHDAYAATNFPLGVVTLYPAFFTVPTDGVERAAILLHEAEHLLGAGEETALERVWRNKQRIGWTSDNYGSTRVWRTTKGWTAAGVPGLFDCGPNRRADCAP
jgi:hypothetical protein